MRTEMYHAENIYQESGKVTAVPGESLVVANGTLGQTYDLYEGGYAQIGFKGETEDGHRASIPKSNFSQDRSRNLKVRESSPRYLRFAFERDSAEDDKSLEIAAALMRFYAR